MIANEHRGSGGPAGIKATTAVGENHRLATGHRRGANRVGNSVDTKFFIKVGAAKEDKHRGAVSVNASDRAGMPGNRRWREIGELGYGEFSHRPAE